jgi:hypothetical protein
VTDTQARLAASKDVAEQVLDGTLPYEEAWHTLATDVLSLAAELERVTAALRKISEGATGATGIPDRDRLIGIKQEADRALAGGARAAQEDDELLHRDPYHRAIQPS